MIKDQNLDYLNMIESVKISAFREIRPILDRVLVNPSPSSRKPSLTIDRQTIAAQEKVAIGLIDKFSKERNIPIFVQELPYVEFVDWLMSSSFRVKATTFKKYVNHVTNFIETMPGAEVESALNILYNYDDGGLDLRSEDIGGRPHIIKHFPIDDFETIINHLRFVSRSRYSRNLSDLLEASMLTGLRPCDWQATSLIYRTSPVATHGRFAFLCVANRKATNGRGNGIMRLMDLSAFSTAALLAVEQTVWLAKSIALEHNFESDFCLRFARMMYRTTGELWPDSPLHGYSLYSVRNQAASNWKVTKTAVEIAALYGHAMPQTAARFYGHSRNAWPHEYREFLPEPSPFDVARIQSRVDMHKHYEKMKSRAGADSDPREVLLLTRPANQPL